MRAAQECNNHDKRDGLWQCVSPSNLGSFFEASRLVFMVVPKYEGCNMQQQSCIVFLCYDFPNLALSNWLSLLYKIRSDGVHSLPLYLDHCPEHQVTLQDLHSICDKSHSDHPYP